MVSNFFFAFGERVGMSKCVCSVKHLLFTNLIRNVHDLLKRKSSVSVETITSVLCYAFCVFFFFVYFGWRICNFLLLTRLFLVCILSFPAIELFLITFFNLKTKLAIYRLL